MHELSVTQAILKLALSHADAAGADRVTDLYLVVGDFSSVVDDSVQFYWDFVSEGTAAAGATLHFRRVPATLRCRDCDHPFTPQDELACPRCQGLRIEVLTGEEFHLEAIDVTHQAEEVTS